jgi:hypothetical protein
MLIPRILLLLVLASQSFGCKSFDIHQIEWGHHISVDEDGRARGHVKSEGQDDFTYKEELGDKEFKTQYVDPILKKLEESVTEQYEKTQRPAQILIFIHGGLNTYDGGLEHIQGFLHKQKDSRAFPNLSANFLVSLNWEAGLPSALRDHFFQIRFGERSPTFAKLTSPIVLLHDLGESIVKAPDALYSEAKDLLGSQSADFTSAIFTTGFYASVYGLPIAAISPSLTIADVMPNAVYAAAGAYGLPYFYDDLTRYFFGPIRMVSAPFIEGFGTPAWDMLKRRPDLLLFNPATGKDGATQQLLKQLAGKIKFRDGKNWETEWETDACQNNAAGCHRIPVELTLLGHSMGAMVSDRILATLSKDLTFKHIIYMGAANSIADFKLSVIPYLRDHSQSKFWSFALSEQDERNEKYHPALDFVMRGSLLVWIDLLLERAYGLPQRRFGREANQDWLNIDSDDVWNRICRISFSGNRARTEEPRKHGDFTNADKVELVLEMIKKGCPEPVKITKDPSDTRSVDDFRKELRRTLEYVPRFTPKSIAHVSDNAPYSKKGDLDDGEFLSEQSYEEIGEYFAPVNINAATTDQLALLLRGDRYLARTIFEGACKNSYSSIQEVKDRIKHLPSGGYRLIKEHGTYGDPTLSPACPPPDWQSTIRSSVSHWWSNVHLNPFYRITEKMEKIRDPYKRYRDKVMSEIETARINILSKGDDPFDAILDIEGQRAAVMINTWAQLEMLFELRSPSWNFYLPQASSTEQEDQKKLRRAEQLADDISGQAVKFDVHAVIFVTNEDVFSKQSMAKAIEVIQKALGEKFQFHSVHGLPKSIPGQVVSFLQRHTK